MSNSSNLARKIGLPLVTLYGLGTILGAGIYVLVGKVAGEAGLFTPLAFLVAAVTAGITGLSYAQLVVMFPRSAGEAVYVRAGFNNQHLSTTVGWLIVFTGIVSSATLASGFVGYLNQFIQASEQNTIIVTVLLLGGLAVWGISESLWVSAIMTLIEIGGLIFIIFLQSDTLIQIPHIATTMTIPDSGTAVIGVLSGAFLAFYAFIGFEDMVNIVEEVKDPAKTMPKSIFLAITVSTLLYILISLVAIAAIPIEQLASSAAPLSLLVQEYGDLASKSIAAISLFAILNGILIQIIMGSRVLYGMANQNSAPALLGHINKTTQTPHYATLMVTTLVLVLALWFPLVILAKATSFIILIVFTLVNFALIKLQQSESYQHKTPLPTFPWLGATLCISLLIFQLYLILK